MAEMFEINITVKDNGVIRDAGLYIKNVDRIARYNTMRKMANRIVVELQRPPERESVPPTLSYPGARGSYYIRQEGAVHTYMKRGGQVSEYHMYNSQDLRSGWEVEDIANLGHLQAAEHDFQVGRDPVLEFSNDVPYSVFVQSDLLQGEVFKEYGWKIADDIIEEFKDEFVKFAEDEMRSIIINREGGFGGEDVILRSDDDVRAFYSATINSSFD